MSAAPQIEFTDNAASKVRELALEEANPELKLRVYISGGGCSGFQYGFAFDETIEDGDAVAASAAAATGAAAADATAEAKPRRNFLDRLFGGRRNQENAAEVAAGATAANAAAPDVETQTLDPVTTGAAAAIARAEADDKPAPRPTPAQAPASSGVRNPFIQVGLFTVEANAAAAASNLRQEGIVPSILQGDRNGDPFWRVVVGPVTTADDQATMLARVKRLGFSDAYLAPN